MAKETRKQIVEQTRNEVARKYAEKIGKLESEMAELRSSLLELNKLYSEEKQKSSDLGIKVNQYEDWIHRLQEFMDMPDDAREQAIKELKEKHQINSVLDSAISQYASLMLHLF